MQALLGRSYHLPVLILARAAGPSSFPSSVNDTLTISDSPAGLAVTFRPARTMFINRAAQQYATQLMGSTSTSLIYYAPAAVISSPGVAGDSLSISDTVARGATALARAVNDSLTISDSPARFSTLPRSAADSLSISDAAARGLSTPRAAGDTLTISDSPAGSAVSGAVGDRVMLLSTAAQRQATTLYSLVYPITLYYAPAAITSQPTLVGDALSISDAVTQSGSTQARAVGDSLTITDSPAGSAVGGTQGDRTLLLAYRAAQQQAVALYSMPVPVTLYYAPAAVVSAPGAIFDSLTITDSVSGSASSPSARRRGPMVWSEAYNRAQLLMSQVLNPLIMYSIVLTDDEDRAVSDTVTISDGVARSGGIRTRAAGDSLTISDAVVRSGGARTRAAGDSLSISDTAAAQAGNARSVNDSLTITDAVTRGAGVRTRAAADSLTITDTPAAGSSSARSVADSLAITDTIARAGAAHPRAAADTLTINDSPFVTGSPARLVTDSISISDTVTRLVVRTRLVNDSLTITDNPSGVSVGAPFFDTDWEVKLVGYESSLRSTLSDSYVYADVSSENDLRADVVEMAFTALGESPVSGDWVTADWADWSTSITATAAVHVTEEQLPPGRYMVWVRVTHPPIRPVLRCGQVRIF